MYIIGELGNSPNSLIFKTNTYNIEMRKIINQNSIPENIHRFRSIIDPHIDSSSIYESQNRKKNIEICHVAKFLMNLDETSYIKETIESPDFIISCDNKIIGVEHQILINDSEKSYEGFFENIFRLAEIKLRKDYNISNVLINCWLYDNIEYKLSQKNDLVSLIVDLILFYIKYEKLKDNLIIERVYSMPHSELSLCPNFGAWFQEYLTIDSLELAIHEKEKKLAIYREKANEIWLLIVIGGTGASSYEILENESYQINSDFDKIYLLEDFNNNLYRIK